MWRLLSPYFMEFRFPILSAALVAVFVGFYDEKSGTIMVQRVMGYFPYFLMGIVLKRDYLKVGACRVSYISRTWVCIRHT